MRCTLRLLAAVALAACTTGNPSVPDAAVAEDGGDGSDGGADSGPICPGARQCVGECCAAGSVCDSNEICCPLRLLCGTACCGIDEVCEGAACHLDCGTAARSLAEFLDPYVNMLPGRLNLSKAEILAAT